MAYTGPNFVNDGPPALNSTNLNGMVEELELLDKTAFENKDAISENANWKAITWVDGKGISRTGSIGTVEGMSYAEISLAGMERIRFTLIATSANVSFVTKDVNGLNVTKGYIHTPILEWIDHVVLEDEVLIRISCDTASKGDFLFYYYYDSASKIGNLENDIDTLESDLEDLQGEIIKQKKFGEDAWVDGKYTPNNGTDGSSKVSIHINSTNAEFLTVRTKQYIPDNVREIISTGNYWYYIDVYDWNIGVDYTGFIGMFDGTSVVTGTRGIGLQYANLVALKEAHPSYHFQLTVCDNTLDSTTRPTIQNVNNAVMYSYSVLDTVDVKNPCDYDGSFISTFNKILCIGDSFTAGTFNYYDASDQYAALIDAKYSYPTFLKKIAGVDTTNMGDGGKTCETWYNAHSSDDLSGHDCCIIALGINDASKQEGGWNETSNTYLTNILTKVKNENNNIKIFVSTIIPALYYHGTAHMAASAAIRTFVENYNDPNVILLDLAEYGHTMDKNAYQCRHLTAIGYERLAQDVANYVSYIMENNSDVFRNVQFVGTQYTLGNW